MRKIKSAIVGGFGLASLLNASCMNGVGVGTSNKQPEIKVYDSRGVEIRKWDGNELIAQDPRWDSTYVLPVNRGDIHEGNEFYKVTVTDPDRKPLELTSGAEAVDELTVEVEEGVFDNYSHSYELHLRANEPVPRGGYKMLEIFGDDGRARTTAGFIALVSQEDTYDDGDDGTINYNDNVEMNDNNGGYNNDNDNHHNGNDQENDNGNMNYNDNTQDNENYNMNANVNVNQNANQNMNVNVNDNTAPPHVECYSNANCGTDGYVGAARCEGDEVRRDFARYTCHYPGTENSHCASDLENRLVEECDYGCANGTCVPAPTDAEFAQTRTAILDMNGVVYTDSNGNGTSVMHTGADGSELFKAVHYVPVSLENKIGGPNYVAVRALGNPSDPDNCFGVNNVGPMTRVGEQSGVAKYETNFNLSRAVDCPEDWELVEVEYSYPEFNQRKLAYAEAMSP
jgi:hypothetical protein